MTIKEIADLCEVDKRTVSNKIKKLKIEPTKVLNRYEVSEEEAKRIIKKIRPNDFSMLFEKANFKNAEKTETAENKNADIKDNGAAAADNAAETAYNTADIGAKIAETNKELIELLKKRLEEQDKTIEAQQNTIDNLVKANAGLSATIARLEDKSQERQQDIVINQSAAAANSEPTEEEPTAKKHWWERLFA